MLSRKIAESKRIINKIDERFLKPIIYCGFGKDSITLLHLCREAGYNWPVMFHRDPYFPKKYRYANKIIDMWDVVCWDYPAKSTSIFNKNNTFEVVRHYGCGSIDMVLCAMLYEPTEFIDGEYLCAYRDIYLQPKGNGEYHWDCALQAHRMHESKPHGGNLPNMLRWVMKTAPGGPTFMQPLREWTNKDIYEYIRSNNIPINYDVYEVKNGELVPLPDNTFNPDRRPACFRCIDERNELVVHCPRMDCLTNNISSTLVKVQMPNDYPRYQEDCKEK